MNRFAFEYADFDFRPLNRLARTNEHVSARLVSVRVHENTLVCASVSVRIDSTAHMHGVNASLFLRVCVPLFWERRMAKVQSRVKRMECPTALHYLPTSKRA